MAGSTDIQLLDCTIRDGGYVNDWRFSRDMVRETYRALSKSGVDYVEIGFRGSEKYFNPEKFGLWRFTTEEELRSVTRNIRGAAIALMGDFGKIDLEDFPARSESLASLVRLAVNKTKVYDCIDLLEKIKAKGYLVSLQCMGYNAYTEAERRDLLTALAKTALDYVYVGDSYGSILPFQMAGFFEPMLAVGTFKAGFHPHNNVQMAFANTLEAMRLGVHIVDSTIYGMGRGAGNLPTEVILAYLSLAGGKKYNPIPVLNCIERFYLNQFAETPWGYQLPYMISGIFNTHPNYAKELLGRQEYSMEDIWKAMHCVRQIGPVGYDSTLLGELLGQGVIGGGKAVCQVEADIEADMPDVVPPYLNRHPDREFLVLANGPTLKAHHDEIRRFIELHDPVILGANFLSGLFIPHYHAFNNKKRFESHVETVAPSSTLLLGVNFPEDYIREYVSRDYEPLVFRDVLHADFDIRDGVIMTSCRTISALLVGVAVVMGAKRVFVAGMDGYAHQGGAKGALFYNEQFDPKEHELNLERHNWNDRFLRQIDQYLRNHGGEGVHILTPTGHTAFYKSIENYI
jgi:4-hydroxy 2-oxovalerate aldolase